jgi:YidC/Oxa1 family membrane protein insertase
MQQKNLMVFTILSIAILSGWLWIQHQIWPPPPRDSQKKDAKLWPFEKMRLQDQGEIFASLLAQGSPLAGSLDPFRIAVGIQVPPFKKVPSIRVVQWQELPSPVQKALLLVPPPLPLGPEMFSQLGMLTTLKEAPIVPTEEVQTIVLGGAKHHLKAVLTTRGAGVQKLTLNKFEAADWLGRPEKEPLELIQDDPILPSFLMYHFPTAKAERPEFTLGDRIWKLESQSAETADKQEVRFSTQVPGREYLRIHKIYRLEPGHYHLGLTLEITDERDPKGTNDLPTGFRYQLSGAHGLPIEGEWYTSVFRTAVIGTVDARNNLWRDVEDSMRISHRGGGERIPEGDLGESHLQYAGVMTQYFSSVLVVDDQPGNRAEGGVDSRKILAWARPTQETSEKSGRIAKLTNEDIHFESQAGGTEIFKLLPRVQKHIKDAELKVGYRAVLSYYVTSDRQKVATWIRPGQVQRNVFDDITVRVNSQEMVIRPGEKVQHNFLLYHGPVKVKLLGQMSGDSAVADDVVDRYRYTLHLGTLTDYRSAGPFGWFAQKIMWTDLIIACTNIMHWLLNNLRFFGHGLSIILLTVIVRGLMFPVSRKQAIFAAKMQELAPEMKKLQEKYKNDPRGKTEATMELYRKHNVHPLGGCLPIFLQMPIFIGLYFALQESIFFRLSPFLWIRNLSAPDMLLYWSESIPLISDPDNQQGSFFSVLYLGPYFNVLPIIAVTLMIIQQKVMTPPAQDEQQEMQFKLMRYMMVVFGLLFYKVAAGLCIYFIASSLWGLAERRFLPKKKAALPTPPTKSPPTPGPRTGPSGRKTQGKAPEKKNGQIQKVRDWWQEVLKQAKKK